MKYLSAFGLLLFAGQLQAQVYQCTVEGVTTFSQQPCSEDAKEIEVNHSQPLKQQTETGINSQTSENLSDQSAGTLSELEERRISIKKRDLSAKIKRLERQAVRQARQRDAEIAQIKSERGRYVQNIYGVLHEDKINSAILAATTLWNTKIDETNKQLEQARAEINKLEP